MWTLQGHSRSPEGAAPLPDAPDRVSTYVLTEVAAVLALKLTQVGNSVGVVLPKEVLASLKLEKGDTIFLTETPDGYKLTPYDAEFAAQMSAARTVAKRRRNALRELAK